MSEAMSETETMTVREAVREALREEMARDESVVVYGEDVGEFGGVNAVTGDLMQQYGEDRVVDTPISEAGFIGAAVGAAASGMRPVPEIMFVDFIGVPMEQIHNQLAKMRYMFGGKADLPVTIRTTEGGGQRAASQHSSSYHTWFAHLPGVKAATPGSPRAAKGLLKSAIRSDDPVIFFENKVMYENEGEVPTDEGFTIPLGEAHVEREGDDVTVVASQRLVNESLTVAEEMAATTDVEVIDIQSLYPMDTNTILDSVEKTGRLVVADESPLSYGSHGEVISRVVEDGFYSLDAPIQRVGIPDVHIPFSPPLEDDVVPSGDEVRAAIEQIA
ncbi:MAG: pyruvate/2-oxoglutarate/acetoin dehydrogenase E1 component [Halobacteriales archaeon]|jgi:pyruvate/2-oxoglutarate/acetoin dehydrogenase E1 component